MRRMLISEARGWKIYIQVSLLVSIDDRAWYRRYLEPFTGLGYYARSRVFTGRGCGWLRVDSGALNTKLLLVVTACCAMLARAN